MKRLGFNESNINVRLVEKQLSQWKARCRDFNGKKAHEPEFRFMTIAEDEGSLGYEITGKLSRQLGWHVFDEEIIHYIAQNSQVSDKLVRQLDKKSQGSMQETIERFLKTIETHSFSSDDYREGLLVTLLCLAREGSAILVGRGANFALYNEKHGLKLRLTASPEVRIRRLSELWKVNNEEARHRMHANEEEKRKFIRHYYYHNYDDPWFYDVIFNTDRTPVDSIVSSISGYVKLPSATDSNVEKVG